MSLCLIGLLSLCLCFPASSLLLPLEGASVAPGLASLALLFFVLSRDIFLSSLYLSLAADPPGQAVACLAFVLPLSGHMTEAQQRFQ